MVVVVVLCGDSVEVCRANERLMLAMGRGLVEETRQCISVLSEAVWAMWPGMYVKVVA